MSKVIIKGKVQKGKTRGKGLGFPTANINLHRKIPDGIYISRSKLQSRSYPSLTFVGAARTFGESKIQAETYFLSNVGNIYGKWITVSLIKKIRSNQKFQSASKLKAQMKKDEKFARKYFKIEKHV